VLDSVNDTILDICGCDVKIGLEGLDAPAREAFSEGTPGGLRWGEVVRSRGSEVLGGGFVELLAWLLELLLGRLLELLLGAFVELLAWLFELLLRRLLELLLGRLLELLLRRLLECTGGIELWVELWLLLCYYWYGGGGKVFEDK